MADFTRAHWFTARWEGGITDHPNDPGGYTAFGVSTSFMKDFAASPGNRGLLASLGLSGTISRAIMKKIDAQKAARILQAAFWDSLGLSALPQIPATLIYDASVNLGLRIGPRLMQQAVNNVARAGLAVDGIIGPKTIAAIFAHQDAAAPEALRLRKARYHNIAASKPGLAVFLKGWLNRASDLEKYVDRLKREGA